MNYRPTKPITELILAVISFLLMTIIAGLLTKFLWNSCLIPVVNGINEITFWQAIGLDILFGLLIRSKNMKNKIRGNK